MLASARNGVSLFIEQLLDAHDVLDIPAPVHALARAALHRLQLREFRFPETQDIGGKTAESGNLADSEIELLRNLDLAGPACFAVAFSFRSHSACQTWRKDRRKARFPVSSVSSMTRALEQPHFVPYVDGRRSSVVGGALRLVVLGQKLMAGGR